MAASSWSSFTIETITSPDHPLFDEAFRRLWDEFGERGEMERRDVIASRLTWDPQRPVDGHALLYEMLVVRRDGGIVAIRDHTAIAPPAVLAGQPGATVVAHLSHVLVEPPLRGSGLAAWLRALPVAAARRCFMRARAAGDAIDPANPGDASQSPAQAPASAPPITLVAEMEHDDAVTPAIVRRLRSYARAGFRVVDPAQVRYGQPDFRNPAEIERTGVRDVPLCLVLRRVGREHEEWMTGAELRETVGALQTMFAVHVRADHMQDVRELAGRMPGASQRVALLVPGSAISPLREIIR